MDIAESLQIIAERYRATFSLRFDPSQRRWSVVLGKAAIASASTADEVVNRILHLDQRKVEQMMRDMSGGDGFAGLETTEVGHF